MTKSRGLPGTIRERRPGVWQVSVSLGRDADGRYPRKTATVHGTAEDAVAKQLDMVRSLRRGTLAASGPVTIRRLLEEWTDGLSLGNLSPASIERYRIAVTRHLVPALGTIRADALTPAHLRRLYAEKMAAGLSPGTTRHLHEILRRALAQAVDDGVLEGNVAARIKHPPRPAPPEMHVLTEEATAALLTALEGGVLYVPVLVAVTTGLREGEILGLQWQDIDLAHGVLHVRRTLSETMAGVRLGPPKSKHSARPVPLPAVTIAALREHQVQQVQLREALGARYIEKGLVFPDTHVYAASGVVLSAGREWKRSAFGTAFRRKTRSLGVKLRFHDLRHTHATLLLRAGVHPKVVSERLGHAGVAITLDTYSHVLPDTQAAAVEAIDAFLLPPA